MAKSNLVIVESPAKAKTIAGYLGDGYVVKSSIGHLRDLPSKGLGVDIKNNFAPTYEVDPEKKKIVTDLKKSAKNAEVWLATDEDREGEAIAWHLCSVLGLDPANVKRIVFHEITKPAIEAAVKSPRHVDMHLVDSQQARRILDRLVGYELSPVLWKKIRTGLSAGRVQSVAVRLLVEREKEIRAYTPDNNFRVSGEFFAGSQAVSAELDKRLDSQKDARQLLEACQQAEFKVAALDQRPGTRSPSAPFTTSTLQQEASRKIGYGVRQTMRLAQKLYEAGHITYMRTDSSSLSDTALKATASYIKSNFGDNYYHQRQYATKSRSAQEAHEAIRPTDFNRLSAGADKSEQRLYELIWQRALSSQMASAKIEYTDLGISISNRPESFKTRGQVLVFDGFMKVYKVGKEDIVLPKLKIGDTLKLGQITAQETFSRAPARYSEASLVKKLEQLGIGRPSTYAPTISTIQDRGYVEKRDVDGEIKQVSQLVLSAKGITTDKVEVTYGADRQKLIPTELAEIVTDFLIKYFGPVMDYGFTARAEQELDEVAEGKLVWQNMLAEFYKDFHPLVDKSESASREEASGSRVLGKHPKTNLPITARMARFGPVLQMGEGGKDSDEKPQFASFPAGVRLEEVTLEQALPMFDLPRIVGQTTDGQQITADIGRFGPYLKVGSSYTSLKEIDPLSVTEAQARQILADAAKARAERQIADYGDIKILNGPYGPYITDGKRNARIPKDADPKKIDKAQAAELLAKAPARRAFRRGKSAKKAK